MQRINALEYLHRLSMRLHTAGNIAVHDIIQRCKIRFLLTEVHRKHTAADIHAHDIRNDFIAKVSGKANHAALARMHIGHDTHLRISKGRLFQ